VVVYPVPVGSYPGNTGDHLSTFCRPSIQRQKDNAQIPMKTWKRLHDNPGLWEQYFVREKVIRAIRSFFEKEKFHEIETPILIPHPPAESYLDVFETILLNRKRQQTKAYLSTSPEVPLKKLMVAGLGNCYAITKSFRNMETHSLIHNPEFTILEWYRVGSDYTQIMRECEKLFDYIGLRYQWKRMTVAAAFKQYAGVNFDEFFDHAPEIARKKGYTVENHTTWEELYNQIFLNEVEPKLGQKNTAAILYEFPASLAALASKK
jgi:elongation factor P--(R)-beta-lysine ligase